MRRSIELEEKYKVIQALKDGRPQCSVARQFRIAKSTVSTIWKSKAVILRAYEDHKPKIKRLRASSNDAVDRALFTWFRAQVNAGEKMSGPKLRKKAEELARQIGDQEFICSYGWMDRFKCRHGISFTNIKESSEDKEKKSFEHKFWPGVRGEYRDEDVFSVKEVGLYYKVRPDEVKGVCDKVCDHGEDAGNRLTVCLCANMPGTERRNLLVVGNKSITGVSFPFQYKANSKSWVDMKISKEELIRWETELSERNRRVLLLVQYSPAFRSFGDFDHISLGFLPTDALMHPLDYAVNTLKAYYRMYVLQSIYGEGKKEINYFDSFRMINKAWLRTQKAVIVAGFQTLSKRSDEKDNFKRFSLSEWTSQQPFSSSLSKFDLENYENFDNHLVTSVNFTSDAADNRQPLESLEPISNKTRIKPPSYQKASDAVHILYKFFEGQQDSNLLNSLTEIEISIEDLNPKQFDTKAPKISSNPTTRLKKK